MGRDARARQARAVYWKTCRVCVGAFPSEHAPDARIAHLDVCQRCCVADLASLMRTHPATVRMLPTVMALEGRPIVAPRVGGSVTKELFGDDRRETSQADR